MEKIILFLIGFLALKGTKLEEITTIKCEIFTHCTFIGVSFNMNTKLIVKQDSSSAVPDEQVRRVQFLSSNISLLHPDIAAKFPNIETINIWNYDNRLINQEKIENCHNITELELGMKSFTRISASTFTSCTKLRTLRIQTDSITDFPDGVFENQRNLRRLELTENNLNLRKEPFQPLENLETVGFINMGLGKVEKNFFQVFKNLDHLWFFAQYGSQYVFPIESLESQPSLRSLFIGNVNMSQIPDKFAPTLRTVRNLKLLTLEANLITSIEEFTDFPQIAFFNFRNNRIKELPANAFKGCTGLERLELSWNQISVFRGDEFNHLADLEILDLLGNTLKSIAPNTFHPMTNLRRLELNFNRNQVIEKELFQNNSELETLSLRSNNITAIHPEAFDNLPKLRELILQQNLCVDTNFFSWGQGMDWELVKGDLTTCFQNFLEKHNNL